MKGVRLQTLTFTPSVQRFYGRFGNSPLEVFRPVLPLSAPAQAASPVSFCLRQCVLEIRERYWPTTVRTSIVGTQSNESVWTRIGTLRLCGGDMAKKRAKAAKKAPPPAKKAQPAESAAAENAPAGKKRPIETYEHRKEQRTNNPPVGLPNPLSFYD